jgi:sugar (pentulose or hexulose) kinase
MTEKDLILALDTGTQSLKALIFDPEGRLVAKQTVAYQPYFSEQPGWAEQDPAVFWNAIREACGRLWQDTKGFKERIAAVALTTQRGTIVNVDEQGNPLRPAMLWLDQRKTYGLPPVGGAWGLLFRLTGVSETIAYLQAEAEANWIRTHQPDIWKKTHKYLLLSGYLTFRLTGRFVDSIGCQVGYIPFDYKHLRWAPDWSWQWRCLQMERRLLPDLILPGQTLGNITPEVSKETGIPGGLPLIATAADKACEAIGSGSLEADIGCLSYGTTATINVTHKKYVEAIPFLPSYPSAVPDHHTVEVQVYRGFWMVNWFKEEFGHQEKQEAAKQGVLKKTIKSGHRITERSVFGASPD